MAFVKYKRRINTGNYFSKRMNFLNEKAETKRFSDMKSYIEFLMTDMTKFDDYGLFIWSALHHKPCQ